MLKKIFLILSALFIFSACEEKSETTEETAVPVKVYEIRQDSISQYVELTGAIEAENDAVIYAKINEKINEIYVKVGDRVNENQIIAVQHNDVFKQNVEMAEAALKSAESQFHLAEQNYNRMDKLFQQKAVSPQQFDQAESQLQTAEAGLEQAKTQLRQAEENYQNSLIKAPFPGVVAAINFEEGQMVSAGQPVAQVVNPASMKSKLMVSGRDADKVKPGQLVMIEFPAIPGELYRGKVVRLNEAFNPVTNALEIEVRILNPDKRIKSGLFGKFNIELITKKNAIIIPETALQQQTEVIIDRASGVQKSVKKYFIYKINNERAALTEVKIGIRSDGRVEITDGLAVDDKIVVVGQNIVKDSDLVKIIE